MCLYHYISRECVDVSCGTHGVETLRVVEILGGVKIMADTKVISQELFEVLPLALQVGIGEHAILHNTGMQSSMQGRVLSDITFTEEVLRMGGKYHSHHRSHAPGHELLGALWHGHQCG